MCRFSGGPITPALLRGPLPHSGGRRRKRAGLELLLRNPLFFLIFAVRVSQKFCRATNLAATLGILIFIISAAFSMFTYAQARISENEEALQ